MAQWYENIVQEACSAIATAWTDVSQVVRPEQMARRNFARDIESGQIRLPLALLQVGRIVSAPEYAAAGVAVRATVTVHRIEWWEGAGGDQTTDAVGECAALLDHLAGTSQTGLTLIIDRGVAIDGSAQYCESLQRMLSLSLPLTAASLTFDVVTGFLISDHV